MVFIQTLHLPQLKIYLLTEKASKGNFPVKITISSSFSNEHINEANQICIYYVKMVASSSERSSRITEMRDFLKLCCSQTLLPIAKAFCYRPIIKGK